MLCATRSSWMKIVGYGELSRELVRKGSNLGLEALKCTHDAKSSVNCLETTEIGTRLVFSRSESRQLRGGMARKRLVGRESAPASAAAYHILPQHCQAPAQHLRSGLETFTAYFSLHQLWRGLDLEAVRDCSEARLPCALGSEFGRVWQRRCVIPSAEAALGSAAKKKHEDLLTVPLLLFFLL